MAPTGFTRAGANGRLTLAVPSKGRMAEPALRLCADAGLSFEATERSLARPLRERAGRPAARPPHDIPEYVQDGVVHLGITGANLVVEAEADVVTVAELGFARCTLQAAVPDDAPQATLEDLDGLRVATAYPVTTRAAARASSGVEAELVPVSGSVEATPRLGLADAIVDLVSTGSTASANGLRRIGPLLESQAVLIARRGAREAARARRPARADALRRRRGASAPLPDDERAACGAPRIRAVLPGMGAPSVLDLAEPGQIAVHAAVDADDVWDLLRAARRRRARPRSSSSRGEARSVRGGPGARGGAAARRAEIVADVRERGDAALLDWTRAARRRAAGAARLGRSGSRRPASTTTCWTRFARSPRGRAFSEAAAPARHARRGGARASSRSGAGCRSARSGSTCPAAARACRPRS